MHTHDVTADQLRAARHMLRWTQNQLAERSGVTRVTIANIEAGRIGKARLETMQALVGALERAGIELDTNGIRLVDRPAAPPAARRRKG